MIYLVFDLTLHLPPACSRQVSYGGEGAVAFFNPAMSKLCPPLLIGEGQGVRTRFCKYNAAKPNRGVVKTAIWGVDCDK